MFFYSYWYMRFYIMFILFFNSSFGIGNRIDFNSAFSEDISSSNCSSLVTLSTEFQTTLTWGSWFRLIMVKYSDRILANNFPVMGWLLILLISESFPLNNDYLIYYICSINYFLILVGCCLICARCCKSYYLMVGRTKV
jgi:hypothetical protein